jgi:hypothetical protein
VRRVGYPAGMSLSRVTMASKHEHPDADSPGERPKSSAHASTTKNTEPVISETSKLVTSRLAGPSATPPR